MVTHIVFEYPKTEFNHEKQFAIKVITKKIGLKQYQIKPPLIYDRAEEAYVHIATSGMPYDLHGTATVEVGHNHFDSEGVRCTVMILSCAGAPPIVSNRLEMKSSASVPCGVVAGINLL